MQVTQITYRKQDGEVKTYDCVNVTVDGHLTRVELFDEYGLRAASGKKPEYRSFITDRIIHKLVLN